MALGLRLAIVLAALSLGACAASIQSPVSADFRDPFVLQDVNAVLAGPGRLPERYNESISALLADTVITGEAHERINDDLAAFIEDRGGFSPQTSGARVLEFLTANKIEAELDGVFTGFRPARLDVRIVSTTFPNAATMLLGGEMIAVRFMFELSDARTGAVLVATERPLAPYVQGSAGATGGVLGLALRGGGQNRHVMDLQSVADAIAREIAAILSGGEISALTSERIRVNRDALQHILETRPVARARTPHWPAALTPPPPPQPA